jgi:hypothetical protein
MESKKLFYYINTYLKNLDNKSKDEWYCTDRVAHHKVLTDFLKFIQKRKREKPLNTKSIDKLLDT